METSASRFGGFGFRFSGRNEKRQAGGDGAAKGGAAWQDELPGFDDGSLFELSSRDSDRLHKLNQASDAIRPLLQLQYLASDGGSGILVCSDVKAVQRNFYVFTRGRRRIGAKTFVVHERMPAHQQDYIIECLDASCDFLVECPVVLFTTMGYYAVLMERLPWLEGIVEAITADGVDVRSLGGAERSGDGGNPGEPSVSCICLREGEGGRWILTDHQDAAVVQPDVAPAPEMLPRLLGHCVDVQGNQLAPYLVMMFDVPAAWKIYPELATKSLLVFRKNRCATGCERLGIPRAIVWSDVLGLIY